MTWHYQIVKQEDRSHSLHEVYYNKDGGVIGMTEEPCRFVCDEDEGPEGIRKALATALGDAMKYPVLEEPIEYAELDAELEKAE